MALSANGWPVLWAAPPKVRVPGTGVDLRLRPGDVATVLIEVARRFHEEVESIELPVDEEPGFDDWGWAVRPVRGQTSGYSNHAAGCAIDLNATLHPRGVEGTFKRSKEAKVRRILASTWDGPSGRNVVRWGRDYSSAPEDSMHFEVNASPAAVARVAARIRAKNSATVKPAPKPAPPQEEDDDMKSDDTVKLGRWSSAILQQPDGDATYGELVVVTAASVAQMNESIHELCQTMAAMAADIAALRQAQAGKPKPG